MISSVNKCPISADTQHRLPVHRSCPGERPVRLLFGLIPAAMAAACFLIWNTEDPLVRYGSFGLFTVLIVGVMFLTVAAVRYGKPR